MTDSFDEYVRQRGPALLRFAYVLTGNAHLAEDVVQEALARCHRRWRRIEGVPDPYVRKAVVREYLSWRRRRSSTELAVADIPDRAATEAGPDGQGLTRPGSARRRKRKPRGTGLVAGFSCGSRPAARAAGPIESQMGRTDSACGPLAPWTISNSTRWLSSSER